MGTLIPLIILIAFFVINRKKRQDSKTNQTASTNSQTAKRLHSENAVKNYSSVKPIAKSYKSKQTNINSLMDDRQNDWLAKQLRDEHNAFKDTKDMFDLKIEHSSSCDARLIKQSHYKSCDAATIDNATGRSS